MATFVLPCPTRIKISLLYQSGKDIISISRTFIMANKYPDCSLCALTRERSPETMPLSWQRPHHLVAFVGRCIKLTNDHPWIGRVSTASRWCISSGIDVTTEGIISRLSTPTDPSRCAVKLLTFVFVQGLSVSGHSTPDLIECRWEVCEIAIPDIYDDKTTQIRNWLDRIKRKQSLSWDQCQGVRKMTWMRQEKSDARDLRSYNSSEGH